MTTVGDLVNEVRSMVFGSAGDELLVLDGAFTPGDTEIRLRYPQRALQPGMLLSFGLNTFYALQVDSSGQQVTILPKVDGGPEVALTAGYIGRMKPKVSDWSIFRDWNNQIGKMSAPESGLYAFGAFEELVDWQNGTYPLPDIAPWTTQEPIRLLIARYRRTGYDQWQRVSGAEYQPEGRVTRVYGLVPNATRLQFVFAFPFLRATSLEQDVTTLGLNENTMDIPGLGAAATLTRTTEGRRAQIMVQADARRASEVQAGANIGVSREFSREQQARINQEATRLMAQFSYAQTASGGIHL